MTKEELESRIRYLEADNLTYAKQVSALTKFKFEALLKLEKLRKLILNETDPLAHDPGRTQSENSA
jgi:hypothetical protein